MLSEAEAHCLPYRLVPPIYDLEPGCSSAEKSLTSPLAPPTEASTIRKCIG